ncbi:MAG TPA: hypothetical protein VGQ11_01480 [Candidatus Acidoferrales bacterium]|nr:hypothetical protein [Candidatus Acidoferrales bacterium]
MDLFSNPELIRNVRAQLRWGRMISVATICAALSLVVGYALAHSEPPGRWGMQLLEIALGTQAVALVLGGSIACLNAIHREKEMNTFDFQRVTRLTPLELAIGKLFGAPAVVYFAVLCLMPAAVAGAVVGGARPTMVAAAYAILLLGAIAMHALALLISLIMQRGTNAAAVLLLIMFLWGSAFSMGQRVFFEMGAITPFAAIETVDQSSWQLSPIAPGESGPVADSFSRPDVFFGLRFHHVPVLLIFYITFAAWFLLAVTRNIKRDPSAYELYTAPQSLALLLYINALMLGFYRWDTVASNTGPTPAWTAQSFFLGVNLALFLVLGLTLLRNRDRARRRLRELGAAASSWFAALWPLPYVFAGMVLVGIAAVAMVHGHRNPKSEWDFALAFFRMLFIALWLARDLLYLQWMNLTRIKRPLTMGFLYLIVFYVCTAILFAALGLYNTPRGNAITAFFAPAEVFELSEREWAGNEILWTLAMLSQIGVAVVFAWLHRQKLLELSPARELAPTAESPLPTVG